MAFSKCQKCGQSRFEMVGVRPSGAKFNYEFIQCGGCGTVVGVIEADNIAIQLANLSAVVKKIGRQVGISTTELD